MDIKTKTSGLRPKKIPILDVLLADVLGTEEGCDRCQKDFGRLVPSGDPLDTFLAA